MISRKSALLISEIYSEAFTKETFGRLARVRYVFQVEELHDFFYERDYPEWFTKWVKRYRDTNQSAFRDFIKELQTGYAVSGALHNSLPEERQSIGIKILERAAADIILAFENRAERHNAWDPNSPTRTLVEELKAQLELDGYVYREGKLYPVESSVFDAQTEQSYLEILIDSLSLGDPATVKYHVQLAGEDYASGRWSNSIGNSRHFFEAILAQVLEGVITKLGKNLNANVYKNATTTRDHLEIEGLISADEKSAFKQIYGLLSNTGGHAYIAQKDQARLMWHLALTCSQFVLLRYEGFLKAHP
jgi:hypothetical protein